MADVLERMVVKLEGEVDRVVEKETKKGRRYRLVDLLSRNGHGSEIIRGVRCWNGDKLVLGEIVSLLATLVVKKVVVMNKERGVETLVFVEKDVW